MTIQPWEVVEKLTDLYQEWECGAGALCHIVSDDGNYNDQCIEYCLQDINVERKYHKNGYSTRELDIMESYLQILLTIPEELRYWPE